MKEGSVALLRESGGMNSLSELSTFFAEHTVQLAMVDAFDDSEK